jgi:hypothetical protein
VDYEANLGKQGQAMATIRPPRCAHGVVFCGGGGGWVVFEGGTGLGLPRRSLW